MATKPPKYPFLVIYTQFSRVGNYTVGKTENLSSTERNLRLQSSIFSPENLFENPQKCLKKFQPFLSVAGDFENSLDKY